MTTASPQLSPVECPDSSAEIVDWVLSADTRSKPLTFVLAGLAERLNQAGFNIKRIRTSVTTKHPELFVRAVLWHADRGTEIVDGSRGLLTTPQFLQSPVAKVRRGEASVRCKLIGPEADLSYSLCRELAAEGLTDYVVYPLVFSDNERTYISFATNSPECFSEKQLAFLESLLPVFAIRLEVDSKQFTLDSLLQVYLGHNAATRVLQGSFLRGTGEQIHAAIWFCDMRGFTHMADQRPAGEVVRLLDKFFEAVGAPIGSLGGEILKFIGDAVLAIFPVGEDGAEKACQRALQSAQLAVQQVTEIGQASDGFPFELGIGLHIGNVMYGNIGARNRLDFTVIGAVVNEVCRVESLCKQLSSPILMTSAFAAHCTSENLVHKGAYELKGVGTPIEVFTVGGQ